MMLTLEPENFVDLLTGQSRPARFKVNGGSWVFRYRQGGTQQLRLASEFVGHRIARRLEVPAPDFCLARNVRAFHPPGLPRSIPAGIGTATRWLADARFPDVEKETAEPFWRTESCLVATASARVADTWMMNYDRRKVGNIAVRGASSTPEVYFFDFDQAFLAKEPIRPGGERAHWIAAEFQEAMLADRELLSGFNQHHVAQHPRHFAQSRQVLASLSPTEVEELVMDIPPEWEINEVGRCLWLRRLLARREIVLEILEAAGAT